MKTAIIVDTNAWKFTSKKNGGCYGDYKYKGDIKTIAKFIEEYNIKDKVDILISELVLKEQKRQIRESLEEDLRGRERLIKYNLLSPQKGKDFLLEKWENTFDSSVTKFLSKNSNVILIKEDGRKTHKMLNRLTNRYFNHIAPFKDKSDFMDSLIWENILTFIDINKYTNIIILTNDNGFQGCQNELQEETQKNCYIYNNGDLVNATLTDIYETEVKHKDIYNYVNSEYFDTIILDRIINDFQELYPNKDITSWTTPDWGDSLQPDTSVSDEEDTFFTIREDVYWEATDNKEYKCEIFVMLDQIKEILSLETSNISGTS